MQKEPGKENGSRASVYCGGTFDLFHAGHVKFLSMCARLGKVTVALNTDEFVMRYKGNAPVHSYAEREVILSACRYVDEVVPNVGDEDSTKTINAVRPDIIAIGTDWAKKDYYAQMGFTQAWLDASGILLVYLPYTEGVSSTEIKNHVSGKRLRPHAHK